MAVSTPLLPFDMNSIIRLRTLRFLAMAIAFAGCVSHPTTPPASNQVTSDHVMISAPKTAFVGDSVPYTASLDFHPQAPLFYDWMFDSSSLRIISDSQRVRQSVVFHSVGPHIVQLRVSRSIDSAILCSAMDTTSVLQQNMPIITDSIVIFPDSSILYVGLPNSFHIRLLRGKLPSSETVRWTVDTSTLVTPYTTDSGKDCLSLLRRRSAYHYCIHSRFF